VRIALIRQRYTPYGGAERFLEAALEALLERNIAITLYTREWPETRLQLMEPHVVDPRYVGRLWRDRGFARAVCREIARADLDLVQSHERLTCCDVYRAGDGVHAVWLEERLKGASLATRAVVLANPWHRYVMATERRMFANPWLRAVICNSRMVRDEIRTRFDYPEERLHVIYNAVDSTAFHPGLRESRAEVLARCGASPDAVVFLLVGSGYERKGVAAAIEALRELPPPAHLVVVGRDKRLAAYQRLAQRLGVGSRVTIAGPQLDPKPFYGAADVFVLPTIYDPFPNAALEAMACALPVLTSTKSGAAELVAKHDAGLVCPSRDVPGLVSHMRAMLDPATRRRMGANGRAAVLPLTPEAMTLELVLLYKRLLEESAAQRKAAAARRAEERRRRLKGASGESTAEASEAPVEAVAEPPPAEPTLVDATKGPRPPASESEAPNGGSAAGSATPPPAAGDRS
jgi:UDP-glucose:(heptosyl)LPS alpha-1,3-glucosyltransferase